MGLEPPIRNFLLSEESGQVRVINGSNIDQIRQKLSSQESKVKLRLKSVKPRYLDQLSVIIFPSVFIVYNIFYWSLRCI